MKIFYSTVILTIGLTGCQQNTATIETNKTPIDIKVDSDSNYGSKLFANFYADMNRKQYRDSLIKCEPELKYQNYDGYYLIISEKERLRYSIEPNFQDDTLLSISLNLNGEDWIKENGIDQNVLSSNQIRNVQQLYSKKYGQYELNHYRSSKLFDDEQLDIYIWKNDNMFIEFKPDEKKIIYKSYRLIESEKRQQKEIELQEIEMNKIEMNKKKSTEKNI